MNKHLHTNLVRVRMLCDSTGMVRPTGQHLLYLRICWILILAAGLRIALPHNGFDITPVLLLLAAFGVSDSLCTQDIPAIFDKKPDRTALHSPPGPRHLPPLPYLNSIEPTGLYAHLTPDHG